MSPTVETGKRRKTQDYPQIGADTKQARHALAVLGRVAAWIVGVGGAVAATIAGARWILATTFVTHEALAKSTASRSDVEQISAMEAEHYRFTSEQIREFVRTNEKQHDEIKAVTDRILSVLIRKERGRE